MYNNKKNPSFHFIKGLRVSVFIAVTAFLFAGCGTQKVAGNKDAAPTEQNAAQPTTYHVDAHPEVISIAEAVELFNSHDMTAAIAKKYGYKSVSNYDIYRLDSYETVLYKNCRLPKKVNATSYEDTPLPQAKGVSSYVTVARNIQIAVFNAKAYQNLIEQIKGLGFSLAEEGYENRYTNGTIDIYTYEPKKLFRIEKTL